MGKTMIQDRIYKKADRTIGNIVQRVADFKGLNRNHIIVKLDYSHAEKMIFHFPRGFRYQNIELIRPSIQTRAWCRNSLIAFRGNRTFTLWTIDGRRLNRMNPPPLSSSPLPLLPPSPSLPQYPPLSPIYHPPHSPPPPPPLFSNGLWSLLELS